MNNGLKIKKIKTKTTVVNDIKKADDIQAYIKSNSKIVAYLHNEVIIGNFENGNCVFKDGKDLKMEFIQKLRVFNENEELLLWRTKDGLKGRLRTDSDGDETEVVEANQVLFGTKSRKNGEFVTICEDRGTEITLPDNNYEVNDKDKRVAVKTRNYIDYTENLQATYVDARFVEFVQLLEEER